MNMNTTTTTTTTTTDNRQSITINTLNESSQHYSNELHLEVQNLIGTDLNGNNNVNQEEKKKKKKSHGNRKEQHRRRRERRRQQKLLNNTIGNNIEQNIDINVNENNQPMMEQQEQEQEQQVENPVHSDQSNSKSKNKRKRHQQRNHQNQHVNRSMSQLSISQATVKKKRKTTEEEEEEEEEEKSSINEPLTTNVNNNESSQLNNDELLLEDSNTKFQPKYLQASDPIFKQMLSKMNEYSEQIVQHLDTNKKLQMIRKLTVIINNKQYFELQKHLWQSFNDIGLKENIWTSESTTDPTINQRKVYFLSKQLIEKRQKTIEHQLERTTNQLHHFSNRLEQDMQQWQPSIDDFNLMKQLVLECVDKHQQRLRKEFQYKIEITELNLKDRLAIGKFYDLQPNEEQIQLTKKYWETITNEQRMTEQIEILRKRIGLQRMPSKINKTIDRSLDHIQPGLNNVALDKDQRAGLISKYSKTITQYKFDLMALNIDTLESTRRGYQQNLSDLQNKLVEVCPPLLQRAITDRQQTMNKRHSKFLQHKLSSFFDDAPATAIVNE